MPVTAQWVNRGEVRAIGAQISDRSDPLGLRELALKSPRGTMVEEQSNSRPRPLPMKASVEVDPRMMCRHLG